MRNKHSNPIEDPHMQRVASLIISAMMVCEGMFRLRCNLVLDICEHNVCLHNRFEFLCWIYVSTVCAYTTDLKDAFGELGPRVSKISRTF